jgi:alpha-L-rhamnosidase
LLKGLLRRIGLTQQPDGQLKAHSCSERFDIHAIMEDRSCDWVVLLREYYESSGDKALVEELWATLMRLLGWFDARLTGRGLVLAREWEVWDNPLRYQVCEGAGLNAMYYRALVDAAYLAAEVGKTNDAGGLSARAERLKAAFNSLLWNGAEGTYDGALFGPGSKLAEQLNGKVFAGPFVDGPDGRRYGPTAQAVLFALYAGVVPEERLKAARTWMLAHLDEVTGPMSHYYLFRALYAMENAAQDRLVLERMRAGWKLQVESPWQTTWEDLVDEGGSKVHMYGVVPGSFLTTHVLGVRREGHVRERRILIEPRMADLTSAGGIAVTEFGPVRMKWTKMASGTVTIEVVTPEKTEAALRLYSSGESRMFLVDGARREGSWNGGFAEVLFTAGTHQIQYPV